MSRDKRPSFFIVGHSKCGTTALANFLDQHPGLSMCSPKEPNYFVPGWCRASGPPSEFVPRTEAEYLSLFDAAGPAQLCGEASAVYLFAPEAARRIHEFDPDARIIMIFREPVDFLRSWHLQALRNVPAEAENVKDLRAALALEPERRVGRAIPKGCVVPELLLYTDRIRYAEQYDRYAELFPSEQILPLVFDDFRRDNLGTLRRVFEFLQVDTGFAPDVGEHNAGGTSVRSRRALTVVRLATHGSGLTARVRRMLPKPLRRRAIEAVYRGAVFEPAPPLDPQVAAGLRDMARPHVEALGERLDRDLIGEWSYRSAPEQSRAAAAG